MTSSTGQNAEIFLQGLTSNGSENSFWTDATHAVLTNGTINSTTGELYVNGNYYFGNGQEWDEGGGLGNLLAGSTYYVQVCLTELTEHLDVYGYEGATNLHHVPTSLIDYTLAFTGPGTWTDWP